MTTYKKGDKLVLKVSPMTSKTKVATVHSMTETKVYVLGSLDEVSVYSHEYLAKMLVKS